MRSATVTRGAAFVAALLGAAAWFQPAASGADLWWHLAAGREAWARGAPPTTDSFTYTFAGRKWLNQYWLWDSLYWKAWELDPQWVAWLQLAVLVATYAMLFAVARRASGSLLGAVAGCWLAAATSHWFFDIRPHVYTLLFVALLRVTREWRGAPWLWPLVIAAWANIHGGFVFGIGMLGLSVGIGTLERSRRAGRLVVVRREWIGLAACLVAWMANPHGLELLRYPIGYLDADTPYRNLREWLPPGFGWDLRDYRGRFTFLTLVAGLGLPLALRRAPLDAALAAVGCAMAWTSQRFVPLFAITSAPLVALAVASVQRRLERRWPLLSSRGAARFAAAAAGLIALGLWRDVPLQPGLLERWTESDVYPRAAVRYLEALGPPQRLLNHWDWGGYLMLHLPESRIFIDGRANTLFDEAIFLDNRALRRGLDGMGERVARHPADAALLPTHSRFERGLRSLPEPWVAVYEDPTAVVLLPPDSPLLECGVPTPLDVLGDAQEGYALRALAALEAEGPDAAVRVVEAALEREPTLVSGYVQLAWLHALRKDPEAISRAIEAGLEANPGRRVELRTAAGGAFEILGDLPRALAQYRRGVATGPYDSPGAASHLRRLERLRSGESSRRP